MSGATKNASVEANGSRQFVGFQLLDELYGIEITLIQEIILLSEVTRVPQSPAYIEGLINLRGSVIPIIDLRKRFGLAAGARSDESRVMVVNIRRKTIGLIVDLVTRVIRISDEQIETAPPAGSAQGKECIAGLAKLEDRLLILLDIEKVLDFENLGDSNTK